MKTVMRFLPLYVMAIVIFSGCYTEFAAQEYDDDQSYTASDTSYDEEGNVTINNSYYLDDDYRRSRFRLSFNYYYPTYHSSWIASYYYSYYDDPYWGWGSPYWYYDRWPYGCTYPPVVYWPPIYDPWYPYPHYPVVIYHPPYHDGPQYGYYPPSNPGRVRTGGSTRDIGERTRAVSSPSAPATTVVATGAAPTRQRTTVQEVAPVNDRGRDNRAWWEKTNSRTEVKTRQRVTEKTARESKSVYTPRESRKEETQSSKPAYNPPKRSSSREEGKQTERPRESKRSYSPPQSQQAPAQSSPRSSGGNSGSTSNGGERRRTR